MAKTSEGDPTPTPSRVADEAVAQESAEQACEVPSVSSHSPDMRTAVSKELAEQARTADVVPPLELDFLSPAQQPDELGRLAEYRVLKELGHGGMGAVFLAEDPKLMRKVALKVMLPHVSRVEANRMRFLREAQAAAQLEHDNVVTVHQVGEANGVPFIAMPFLKGESLHTRLQREGTLLVSEVIRIGQQIAEGLAAAHEQDLVHRDIKPGNIWLENRSDRSRTDGSRNREISDDRATDDRAASDAPDATVRSLTTSATNPPDIRVKILDFGLARLATSGDAQHLTTSGTILGTPSYMAPEQARGSHDVDFRCDLFSLGVVLYRMATGRQPFSGDTTYALLTALAVDIPAAPRELNPNIPHELSKLITQLLAKQPEARPANAREVSARLVHISRVAQRGESRTSPDADRALDHQATEDATHALGHSVAERQGNDLPTTVILATTEQGRRRKRLRIGLALTACIVLAGTIIKINDQNGTVTEITQDKPTPQSWNHEKTIADADRTAAEWALAQKSAKEAWVTIQMTDDASPAKRILSGEPLPDEPFHVLGIGFEDSPIEITDRDLTNNLRWLKQIQHLELNHCRGITDASVPTLCELGTLRHLGVAGTLLSTASCIELMQRLPLATISLSAKNLSPELIDLVGATPRITAISIASNARDATVGTVTDAQLKSLFLASQLRKINLVDAVADMSTWRELPNRLSNLEWLHLAGEHYTDEHLAEFARLAKLEYLGLLRTSITSAGLLALSESRALRHLDLSHTAVTAEGVRVLHDRLPLCRITWDGGVLEPSAADPDRAAAEWVLAQKTLRKPRVGIHLIGGQSGLAKQIQRGEPLPNEPFRVAEIYFHLADITDNDLAKYLPRLTNLFKLDVVGSGGVTDASVSTLCEIKSLRDLNVSMTGMSSPSCIKLMQALPLEKITFSASHFTPELIDCVCATPSITSVGINGFVPNSVTVIDKQLQSLFGAKHLHTLRLIDVTADMATWRELPESLPNLVHFGVQGKGVGDAHLSEFGRLTNLESFDARGSSITDTGLPAIYDCRKLRELYLSTTVVTAEGVRKLHDQLPLCRITWDGGVIEPGTADPDRAAAEWVFSLKTKDPTFTFVRIQLTDEPGPPIMVKLGEALPDKPFQIVEIVIRQAKVTDSDLSKHLPPLAHITRLSVGHCAGITDASVPTLHKIGGLRSLSVNDTSVSSTACVELMQELPLQNIGLDPGQLTPKVIDIICATPRIIDVAVNGFYSNQPSAPFTDDQLKSLLRAKHLLLLHFENVTADMATWRELPDSLPNLFHLRIGGKHFTDAHLMEFTRLAKLEHLALDTTAITDAGLPALYDSRALRRLTLMETAISAEAARALHDHLPLCRITHPGGIIVPEPE